MRSLSLTLLLLAPTLLPAADPDILPPEEAFPYVARAGAETITLSFSVPEGYYLYRERFAFESGTAGVTLREARFPKGKIYQDEFFGEMEIYRGDFAITIPYGSAGAPELALNLRLQGCADIGICYPPQRWSRTVDLPGASQPTNPLSTLLSGGTGGGNPLPAASAFSVDLRVDNANQMAVSWQIAPGYYMYRDKFSFSVDGQTIQLGTPRLPAGVPKYDEHFGDTEVFYNYVEAEVPFSRASPAAANITLTAFFQGCQEDGICYPPLQEQIAFLLPASASFAASAGLGTDSSGGMISEQDRLAGLIVGGSWVLMLATFYGLGLLLAFTPCVLPMVPILSGIIAGQGGHVTAGRGFALSLTYVMGMALTYTAAGALAAVAGAQVQALFQAPWVITLFAGLFVLLALAMFGIYGLQMPAFIQTRLADMANRQRAGTFVGTAIMGALSALIVTACVAPPLVATLAVIGQTGDALRGALALFVLSLGMGSPLLVVGASAGKLLPKAGPWMNTVKAGFGVMLLGLAIWMMERVLPGAVTLSLWAALVFLTGVFMGALEPLAEGATNSRRLGKGLGLMACLYGALMLVGATLGGDNPLRPLPRNLLVGGGAGSSEAAKLNFRPIQTVAALEDHLAAARAAGQPVMVDFTADWCVSCKEMEEYTFTDANVNAALEPYRLLRADVTQNNADHQALLRYFGIFGPPTIAFFNPQGEEMRGYRLVGYVPASEFAAHVNRAANL